MAQLERARARDARRRERREEKPERPAAVPGEDPDISGIVPGPQPRTEDQAP
jgi:hypothetical protein